MDVEGDVERNDERDVECDVEPHVERKGCCHCTPAKMAASVLAVLVIGKYITNIDTR